MSARADRSASSFGIASRTQAPASM